MPAVDSAVDLTKSIQFAQCGSCHCQGGLWGGGGPQKAVTIVLAEGWGQGSILHLPPKASWLVSNGPGAESVGAGKI